MHLDTTTPTWQRFGPGVSAGMIPGAPESGSKKRGRRRRALWSFVSLLMAAAAIVLGARSRGGADVHVVSARIAVANPVPCDTAADVVGVLTTDGGSGTVAYRWARDGGDPGSVAHQSVAAGSRQTEVHLRWEFAGRGAYHATVELEVMQDPAVTATASFDYRCP